MRVFLPEGGLLWEMGLGVEHQVAESHEEVLHHGLFLFQAHLGELPGQVVGGTLDATEVVRNEEHQEFVVPDTVTHLLDHRQVVSEGVDQGNVVALVDHSEGHGIVDRQASHENLEQFAHEKGGFWLWEGELEFVD